MREVREVKEIGVKLNEAKGLGERGAVKLGERRYVEVEGGTGERQSGQEGGEEREEGDRNEDWGKDGGRKCAEETENNRGMVARMG